MIQDIDIIVNLDNLELLKESKNIIGEIYFKVGDCYFPQYRWTDFAIVILYWWIEAITKTVKSSKKTSCEMLFMDGPFEIKVRKYDNNTTLLKFIHDGKVELKVNCNLKKLLSSIVSVSKNVINELDKRNWVTYDSEKLKKKVKKYRGTI